VDGVTLLRRASEAGLAVTAEGDRLVIRGPRRAEPVARLLIEHKPTVLAALVPGKHSADLVGAVHRPPVADPMWQAHYSARIVHWFLRGQRRWHEAEAIAYDELLMEWHEHYGARSDPRRCAGCGHELLGDGGLVLSDGAHLHLAGARGVECVIAYGHKWRGAAVAALRALGLNAPRGFTLL
jgi:hypothetical protein